MALNKSTLLIRDYETIRHILRDMYIFGCLSREDFIRMGISGRKYDNEQRRIGAYLPGDFVQKRRVGKTVLQYCSYHPLDCVENDLAKTYRNKSFTMLDLLSYFYVQQLLAEHGELTASGLLELLPDAGGVVFTKENLRGKLAELQEAGLIRAKKRGRSVSYSLAEDIWKDFTEEELDDICNYLRFMENTYPLELPFYFLRKKLELYRYRERGQAREDGEVFLFRHNHLAHVIDNDILLGMLRAIRQKRRLTVTMRQKGQPLDVVPVQVIHDCTYGRQYLLCYEERQHAIRQIRLDHVAGVKPGGPVPETEFLEIKSRCEKAEAECFCTSGVNNEPVQVEILFYFDEQREAFILERLRREGHGGKIERLREHEYRYTVRVRDPLEMVPWIRSFGERAQVISGGESRIRERIAEDLKRAVKRYEELA